MVKKQYRVRERDLNDNEKNLMRKIGPKDVYNHQYESDGRYKDFGNDEKSAREFASYKNSKVDVYYKKQRTNHIKKPKLCKCRRKNNGK
jgi:hypothetical protein